MNNMMNRLKIVLASCLIWLAYLTMCWQNRGIQVIWENS